MSHSKPQLNVPLDRSLSGNKTPVLNERFDRYCTHCCSVIENFALEKFPGQKCLACHREVEFLDKSDGIYRRCVRCSVFVRCTAKYCYLCGRHNQHFDPEKPSRLERATKAKLREEIKKDVESEVERKRVKLSVDDLSQSCIEDGTFNDNEATFTEEKEKQDTSMSSSDTLLQ